MRPLCAEDGEGTRLEAGIPRKDVVFLQIDDGAEVKEDDESPREKWPNSIIHASSRSSFSSTASTPKKKVRFTNYGAIESRDRTEDDSVTVVFRVKNIHTLNQLTNACGVAVIVSLLIVIIVLILFRHE
jgi:hypothetical protein